ncbi:GLUG motif-containing protein, partial [Escherichia coli]|uniref:GLUG motif-containing protein n=1 Tax=Escherichia coli TaxID=562 RepID=UPI0039E1F3AF
TGAVTAGSGSSNVGGLMGQSTGSLQTVRATGAVLIGSTTTPGVGTYVGGLIGTLQSGAISGAFATGTVTAGGSGSQYIGGLIG